MDEEGFDEEEKKEFLLGKIGLNTMERKKARKTHKGRGMMNLES
jgi:hypothetical protein